MKKKIAYDSKKDHSVHKIKLTNKNQKKHKYPFSDVYDVFQ